MLFFLPLLGGVLAQAQDLTFEGLDGEGITYVPMLNHYIVSSLFTDDLQVCVHCVDKPLSES